MLRPSVPPMDHVPLCENGSRSESHAVICAAQSPPQAAGHCRFRLKHRKTDYLNTAVCGGNGRKSQALALVLQSGVLCHAVVQLSFCEGHRDEPGRVSSLDLHQHARPTAGLGLDQRRANVADGSDLLAVDIEDDVTCF